MGDMDEEAGVKNLAQAGFASTIRLSPIVENTNFNVTSTMLHLLSMMGLFGGLAHKDPNRPIILLTSPKNISVEDFFLFSYGRSYYLLVELLECFNYIMGRKHF
ncbi:hypothetical protein HAX54_045852 [Datura stramonium]|uniref:Uncharacterized protein n=1 Tax=Datura stramonium TaxID=4076 RepID=A0ABS8WK62_DATST|nr:hypothetical protein [Datura stramonium]